MFSGLANILKGIVNFFEMIVDFIVNIFKWLGTVLEFIVSLFSFLSFFSAGSAASLLPSVVVLALSVFVTCVVIRVIIDVLI